MNLYRTGIRVPGTSCDRNGTPKERREMVSVGLNGKRRERKVEEGIKHWMDGWMIDAGKCHFGFFRPAGPPSFHSTATGLQLAI